MNYAVTSDHFHFLVSVRDGRKGEVIPQSMQLIAGRTSQEYNQRKNRKGAFWEARYHATAVETGFHLILWVEESISGQDCERKPRWTEGIAVGSEAFVEKSQAELGIKVIGEKSWEKMESINSENVLFLITPFLRVKMPV